MNLNKPCRWWCKSKPVSYNFNTPGAIATGLDVRRTSFLTRTGQLPGATIGEVAVTFRGRSLFLAGDREFEQWTTTVLNDTDFMIRNAMERWQNAMNDFQKILVDQCCRLYC